MKRRPVITAIVIGDSSITHKLVEQLVAEEMVRTKVTDNLLELRRELLLGTSSDLIVFCIMADSPLVRRFGTELRRLLLDRPWGGATIRSLGVTTETGLTGESANLGCDIWATGLNEAVRLIGVLIRSHKNGRDNRFAMMGWRGKMRSTEGHRLNAPWMATVVRIREELSPDHSG